MTRVLIRGAPCVAVLWALAPTFALGHITLEKSETTPKSSYKAVLRVPHGCSKTPTTSIAVTIPEGVIGAKPMPKPGWTLEITKGPYARDYTLYHGTVREGATAFRWSGGSLPDDEYDEFVFTAYISDAFANGSTVYFPVVQTCAVGEHRWTEIPAAGDDRHALKEPAPALRIVAPGPEIAMTSVKVGPLSIETPWLRATPTGAKVAAAYLRVVNDGAEPDRLVGATITGAGTASVHAMTMDDGVMRMRPLPDGLAIPPGQSITLEPSSFHLMFENLTRAFKPGERVEGNLVFAKAGTVPVIFAVGDVGGKHAPDIEDHMH